MTDQLGVIVLAAADDRPLDLRPLPLGEVVRAQNYLYPFINQALKSWHEGVVYAVTHDENTYLVPAFTGCLSQFLTVCVFSCSGLVLRKKPSFSAILCPFSSMPWLCRGALD